MAPADIQKAYNLDTVALKGEGQTVALYELDGYDFDDVQTYATQFNLGTVSNLKNVLVDGFTGTPQTVDGSVEVTLDIDMLLALAPNLKNVLVYEGDLNNDSAVLDTYQQIATDNLAQIVSTSWGTAEQSTPSFKAFATAEDTIFQQMATQGQTIFDASGDDGAFDSGIPGTLAVDDPAGHPSVTAVGGTTLTTNSDGTYKSEAVWQGLATVAALAQNGGGSGGGVSVIWPIPSWQSPVTTVTSKAFRNVPDVALNADPNTGYDIYSQAIGGWTPTGGTSAAAPLWAAFTALINEQRSLSGQQPVGFFNPTIYSQALATTPANNYATLFNDVTTGNNLFYAAGVGYDNATGWGSFKGAAWLSAVGGGTGQTTTVSGTVADAGGSPVTTAIVTAYLKSNGIQAATTTVGSDGKYSLTLTSGLAYRFTATAVDYEGQVQALTLPTTASTLNFTLIPSHLYPTGLQMISAPEDYTNVAGVGSLLASATGAAYTPLMYAWAPYQNEYIGTPSSPADTFRIGQGYWVRFPSQMYLALQGATTPTTSVFHLTLQAGWNMIGDPFPVAVSIPAIQVETLASTGATTLSSSSLAQLPLYSYDQTSNAYVQHTTDSIQPYVGYWIFAKQACQLLITPPGGVTPTPPGSPLTSPTSGSSASYGIKLRPR
jgi:subtilase family serine protease